MPPKLNRRRALFRANQDRRDLGLGTADGNRAGHPLRRTGALSVRSPGGSVLAVGEHEVLRRVSGDALPGIEAESLLPGLELAKLARRDRQEFDCATWLHKAREMPKEQFKREVEKALTGRETEPWEIIYFKLYKSQIPVIEQAIETAALMLGSDKSRGYCLEMICADFLAGANLDNPELLLHSISRSFKFLPAEQQQAFVAHAIERAS